MTDRTLTVKTVKTLDVNDIEYELWSGALDRWEDADDNTRAAVFDRICDWTADDEEVDMGTVNDLIWFECDDLFFPEDNEDDDADDEDTGDEDTDDEDDDDEDDAPKPNTILVGRIAGEFMSLPNGSVENTIVHTTVRDGEEFTHFMLVRFDKKQAELVRTHLSVGDLCCIEGRRGEETTDTGVVKQYIDVGHITFLSSRRQDND